MVECQMLKTSKNITVVLVLFTFLGCASLPQVSEERISFENSTDDIHISYPANWHVLEHASTRYVNTHRDTHW